MPSLMMLRGSVQFGLTMMPVAIGFNCGVGVEFLPTTALCVAMIVPPWTTRVRYSGTLLYTCRSPRSRDIQRQRSMLKRSTLAWAGDFAVLDEGLRSEKSGWNGARLESVTGQGTTQRATEHRATQ